MVVDCHTHIRCVGMEKLDVSEHIESAEVVDRCIVLASSDGPPDQVNAQLSEYVGKYQQKMIGFAFINPLNGAFTEKLLKAVTEKLGLKGVVLYCSKTGLTPPH